MCYGRCMTDNDNLDDLLRVDPLQIAEEITGHSYKDNEDTLNLGFLLLHETTKAKQKALEERGDTHMNSDLQEQLTVMEMHGFETVLCDPFGEGESFRIMWHPKGILATVESYRTTRRNSCRFYYNVKFSPETVENWSEYTSSGRFSTYDTETDTYIWVGDHDGREAFAHTFTRLSEAGEFLSPWEEQPFLWLVTYEEAQEKNYDFKALNDERISRLPEYVRTAITPPFRTN